MLLNFTELDNLKFNLSVKILTFNIHNGINWRGKFNPELTAAFIGEIKPDLVGLQEVSRFWSRKTNFMDMVSYFGESLGMFPVFSGAIFRGDQGSYGNLILSKYPVLNSWTAILPGNHEPRNYLAVQVIAHGARVNFMTTHLGLTERERLNQINKIGAFCLQLRGPLIITGDFNESPNGRGIATLSENWIKLDSAVPQGTMRLSDHQLGPEIDMIFTSRDWKLKSLKVYQNQLSDHLPVVAELDLELSWTLLAGQPVSGF